MTATLYPGDFYQSRRGHAARAASRVLGDGRITRKQAFTLPRANRELVCANALPESEVLRRQAEAAQQQ